jgi:3-dehydroquinate synthase
MGYDHYSHGDAVSIGMVLATRLSESMGMVSSDDTKRIIKILEAAGLPVTLPSLNGDEIINVMLKDKKVKNRKIQLVLLKSMGEAYLTSDYPEKEFKQLLTGV